MNYVQAEFVTIDGKRERYNNPLELSLEDG